MKKKNEEANNSGSRVCAVDMESKPEELWEFVRLSKKETGLPYDIFVDNCGAYKNNKHKLWLFVAIDSKRIPVTVGDEPEVLASEENPDADFSDVFKFIRLNRTLLENYSDETTSDDAFYCFLKVITKIEEKND